MWPDRVSNPGPPALESDALPTAIRGPANLHVHYNVQPVILYSLASFVYATYAVIKRFSING